MAFSITPQNEKKSQKISMRLACKPPPLSRKGLKAKIEGGESTEARLSKLPLNSIGAAEMMIKNCMALESGDTGIAFKPRPALQNFL